MQSAAHGRELVEFRNYTLVPGGATEFVRHFEAHFLESQARLGMDVVGLFTVPRDDARFVWVRRFPEPARRADALAQFYGGPVWATFGPRANELMTDYSDVHLLWPDPSLPTLASDRPTQSPAPGPGAATTVVAATFAMAAAADLPVEVASAMTSAAAERGGPGAVRELARLVTADVVNDFPRLPVHEGQPVAIWLVADDAGGTTAVDAAERVARRHGLHLRTVSLAPTSRSRLR